jgi:hypothetical protein
MLICCASFSANALLLFFGGLPLVDFLPTNVLELCLAA